MTDSAAKNTVPDYRPLTEREYQCETCGRAPRAIHHSRRDGADCEYRDCDGGPVLCDQTRRAVERLFEGSSETCHRLARYARGEHWSPSTETFLQPLIATDGEIVLRMSVSSGALWVWWAGSPLGSDYFKCMSTLPHYFDHKVVGRRSAAPSRLADRLEENVPKPIHIENVPETVQEMMQNDRPYREEVTPVAD